MAEALSDDEVMDQFLRSKTGETIRVYRNTIRQWQTYCVAHRPEGFSAADHPLALAWWASVPSDSNSTRKRMLVTLRSFYRFGQAVAHWPSNPWDGIATPRPEQRPVETVLSPDQVTQFLRETTHDLRTQVAIALIISTGLRVSEAAGLRWQDIRRSEDGHRVFAISGAHERYVKCMPAVWDRIVQYRRQLGLPVELDAGNPQPLILGRQGRPIQPNTLTALIARAAQRANLVPESTRRVTAIWLRSAHAVIAHHGGASPVQIQEGLGLTQRRSVDRYLAAAPAIGLTSADAATLRIPALQSGSTPGSE